MLLNQSRTYPRFLFDALKQATDGSIGFYIWMTVLTACSLVGLNTWSEQVAHGMQVTGMNDHVSWGLYIANFTFMVGVAAAAVMMVIPAYLYHDRDMHDSVIVGEILAIAAIVMCLLFVTVDLGRPDHFWHMIPGLGKFNWPQSMLTWDVIVLNGYLLLNLHIVGYLLYMRWRGQKPDPKWYKPFVIVSIIWAVSIHTVTAFLYCGLGGRPFWNTALMAPRFLVSAFVAGPSFIICALMVLQRWGSYPFGDGPVRLLVKIVRITCLINLFMLGSEIFTVLYTGSGHAAALEYLLFGSHGKYALVPWIWTAIGLNLAAAVIFLLPRLIERPRLLIAACIMTFTGVWIEKGMGLIIPGFIPSTLHELVEYVPTSSEWLITLGIWAFGLLIFSVGLKIALPVIAGWTPGLSVGEDRIDAEHRELFDRLNAMVRELRKGQASLVMNETLAFLDSYTRTHFVYEEELMERRGYPGSEGHRQQHRAFVEELVALRTALDGDAVDYEALAAELHLRLRAWLVAHIDKVDRAFGAWLATNPEPAAIADD